MTIASNARPAEPNLRYIIWVPFLRSAAAASTGLKKAATYFSTTLMSHLPPGLKTGRLILQSTEKGALQVQGVEEVWHPARVDHLSLGEALPRDELQCAGQINSAIYLGQFGADQVVVNTEWYPDWIYGVIQETMVYSQIEAHGIGPKFLAHITENEERVYGYMVESVTARHATIDDLQACKAVLAKLHKLEIVYGCLSLQSFLILENGQALLHYFEGSFARNHIPLSREKWRAWKMSYDVVRFQVWMV